MADGEVRAMRPKHMDLMSAQLLLIEVGRYSDQECLSHTAMPQSPLGHHLLCLQSLSFVLQSVGVVGQLLGAPEHAPLLT